MQRLFKIGPSVLPLIHFRTVPEKYNNKNDLSAAKCELGTQVFYEINTSYKQMGTQVSFPADYLQAVVWSFMPESSEFKVSLYIARAQINY